MKYVGVFLTAIVVFFGLTVSEASANVVDFEITTNRAWKLDDQFRNSVKDVNLNKYSAVNWNSSTKSNHKMWFRVVDTAGKEKGKALFNFTTSNTILTNLEKNKSYSLQARRENIIDPITTVKGTWNA